MHWYIGAQEYCDIVVLCCNHQSPKLTFLLKGMIGLGDLIPNKFLWIPWYSS